MKKHHKVHRHRDPSHKRSSKSKSRHKHKKERPLSESVLEPIQEVSKEKVKVDRNACGDNVIPLVLPPQLENEQREKSKRRREKDDKTDKVDRLSEEEINIFAKNYLKKLRESTDKKPVRHHSLEKSGDSFIKKTKSLFRKEKSFNDTVQKVSHDLEISKEHKKERKPRHESEKDEKSYKIKKREEKHKNHEKSSNKRNKEDKGDKRQEKGEKHKKSAKQKVRSKEQLPTDANKMYNRVQEVIYCQLDPVPFKLKNDKSGSEIKDLYQRIKREKRKDKKGDRTNRDKSYDKEKHDAEKNVSYQSHHISGKLHTKEEKRKRSKSRSKREYEDIQNVEAETHSKKPKRKDRNHGHHQDHAAVLEDSQKKRGARKSKRDSVPNIDLGPYHKYFAFENKYAIQHCHEKHHIRDLEGSSRDKKHKEKQEQLIYTVEYDHRHCKRQHDKHEGKTEPINEKIHNKTEPINANKHIKTDTINDNKHKTDEDKIHQLVEGDLKTYFTKIQHMIDKKLDTIININKSKHEKTSNTMLKEKENHKRSKSKSKHEKTSNTMLKERDNHKRSKSISKHEETSNTMLKERENRKRSKSRAKDEKSKKEERSDGKKRDASKDNRPEDKDKMVKEEIIQEVLKRIKKEARKESSLHREEQVSTPKPEKHADSKHKSKAIISDQISKSDRKHPSSSKIRQDISSDRKIEESKSKRHHDSVRDLDSSRKSSSRKQPCEELNKPQQKEPLEHRNNRKLLDEDRNGSRHSGFHGNVSKPNYLKDTQDIRKSLEKKQHSIRTSSHVKLDTRSADKSGIEWEAYLESKRRPKNTHKGATSGKGDLSCHSLTKHYTSASSCRACSDHHLEQSVKARHKSDQVHIHPFSQGHVVGNEICCRERSHLDKRRNATPERMSQEINSVRYDESHIFCSRYNGMPQPACEAHSPLEHLVPTHPKDYIMAPRKLRKSKHRIKNCTVLDHCPAGHHSKHDGVVQYTAPNLEKIILPPEMFRTPERINNRREQVCYQEPVVSPERQHPKQEFVVQGIEPPILECSAHNSARRPRTRNLECKTVSIIGIPPHIRVKEVSMANQTETCSRSQKSSTPERDLVEKRRHSKRFRLYYKYSVINNSKEEDSGTSDAKSIVSDSFRVISDPSDEDRDSDVKTIKEHHLASDLLQTLTVAQKKWTRMATPRDSHLNNILEEPSNMSNSIKHEDYFIPMRGTHECYFRAFTSSHSEYCFKINKKPANSNISIVSKDTVDGRYRFYEDGRCRYCKHDGRSKSDVNTMVSNCSGIQIFRSKSDVFLGGASGKKVIKSIFLEDSHPYVKSRAKPVIKQNPVLQNIFKRKEPIKTTTCKDCQTSDVKVNSDVIPVDEEENTLAFKDKQEQFKDIYKTIDDLEENIHSSRRAPPQTLDVAVSPRFMSLDKISDKKPQFNAIYDTIDALQSKVIDPSNNELVKTLYSPPHKSQRSSRSEPRKITHDMAVGDSEAPVRVYKSQRSSRSEPRRRSTHEVAVGDSTIKTPGTGSGGKRLKSTGVSPIRVVEDIKHLSRGPIAKTVTPQTRSYATRPSMQRPSRNIPDDSMSKKTAPKVTETKREPISLRPKLILVKNTKAKSPERTQTARSDRRNLKPVDVFHHGQAIRVLRSEEKSAHLKKRETMPPCRSKDRKTLDSETKTTPEENQILEKKEAVSKATRIFVNVLEDGKPVITVPTNTTEISSRVSIRKYTPKGKGDTVKKPCRNREDDLPKSCVHHDHPKDVNVRGSSKTSAVSRRTPAGTPNTPITVNTALYKSRPIIRKGSIPCDKTTSSSLGDISADHMRSRSLVQIRTQRENVNRSQSEIINVDGALAICNSGNFDMNGGSVISGNLEKFSNVPRLRCQSSKSNVNSLDQFITRKFTSRLLLTKDYKGGEISAYQKRKLYDQSIRQKMKKKIRFSKLNVGPQIYEVRFLSMAAQENSQSREGDERMKRYLDRPLITLNLEKVKAKSSLRQTTTHHSIIVKSNDETTILNDPIVKKEDVVDKESAQCFGLKKFLKVNDDGHTATDVQKDKYIKHIGSAKGESDSVTQLYFHDHEMNEKKLLSFCNKLLEVNSSLVFPDEFKGAQCDCSKYSESCQSCKNFVRLMDMLCSSVASYCDSKTKLINFELEDDTLESCVQSGNDNESNSKVDKPDVKDEPGRHVHFPNLEIQEASNNVQEIYSRSGNILSGESTDQTDKIFRNLVECVSLATTNRTDNDSILSQPLSCPILPTNTSSFEFLYEESTSTDNEGISREIMLANLTRPFDRTFNFSLSQYNVETPFFRRNSHFSGTASSESGYDSVKSKSCKEHSLTNFFKKYNSARFLRAPALARRKSELSEYCEQKGHGDFKKSILYEEMTKSCKLYAKKVRESSEMKCAENVDKYQEFSLALLLGKNSSALLETTALKQEPSTHITLASNEDSESNIGEVEESKANKENDEISGVGDDFFKSDEIPFVENGCKLVLSNEQLKIDSFTYLGRDIFNDEYSDLKVKVSKQSENRWTDDSSKKGHDNTSFKDDDSSFSLAFSLDSNNPFVPSRDALTKKFFGSLLKVYDKEIEFCNELFKNDDFLNDVLLPAVKKRKHEEKRNKKGRFSRFFKKKLPMNQTSSDETKCEPMINLQVKASMRLQSLASNAKKCFSMFAEAVKMNDNINDEIKICGLLKLLERIENGDFYMIKNEVDANIEHDIKSQVKEAFISIYEICEKEAKKAKRNIGNQEISLIRAFISKYRIGLLSKTDIVACYIGRGVIQTEAQLKAAVTYLTRTQSSEINVEDFEVFCNLTKSYEK